MRCAVILGESKLINEIVGSDLLQDPRLEYLEIARRTGADVLSFTTASAERPPLFRAVFGRSKKIGSALNAAMVADEYDRFYVTEKGIGLPLALLLKARGWRGRMICVVHNGRQRYKRLALAVLGNGLFEAFVTVNDFQEKILVEQWGIPRDKMMSIYNWVDTEFFRPAAESGDPYVLSCGAENRDYATLARAAARLDARFSVYGHGWLASGVSRSSELPNWQNMPRVPYRELRDAYAASAVVAVPLNDVNYAAGVTGLVEGMAAGRPVVVTASRGIANYLAHLDPANVVAPGDDAGMARAIDRLLREPELRAEQGRRNRAFAQEHCSVDRYADMIASRLLRDS